MISENPTNFVINRDTHKRRLFVVKMIPEMYAENFS